MAEHFRGGDKNSIERSFLPRIEPGAASWILHLTQEVAQAYKARQPVSGEAIVIGEENIAYRVGIPPEWRRNALFDARVERRQYEGLSNGMKAAAMEGVRHGRLMLNPDPELDALRDKARELDTAAQNAQSMWRSLLLSDEPLDVNKVASMLYERNCMQIMSAKAVVAYEQAAIFYFNAMAGRAGLSFAHGPHHDAILVPRNTLS